MKRKINILFPIETISRDLDYKLLLASLLLKDNEEIVIGQHDAIDEIISSTTGGIYLGKTIFKDEFNSEALNDNCTFYNRAKNNNYDVIYLDEEGGIYPGERKRWESILDIRLNPRVLDCRDVIFTWGEFQKNYFSEKKGSTRVINTGHPRFDLNKSQYKGLYKGEIESIVSKYTPYILVNTNFTLANSNLGMKYTFGYHSNDPDLIESWAHTSIICINFIKLIHRLSISFPKMNIIVRPHPSENPDYYKTTFNGLTNVIVNSDGPVGPWIMGAELIIHDGCSTAVEAYFAKIPVINYKTDINSKFDLKIPNKIGIQCVTEVEVIEAVNNIIVDRKKYLEINQFDKEDFSMLRNLNESTMENVVDLIRTEINLKTKTSANVKNISYVRLFYKEILYKYYTYIKSIIKKLISPEKYQAEIAYNRLFPGFSKKNIEEKIGHIEKIVGRKIELKYVSGRILIIKAKDINE
jgi:surface carbohydrate biosynthesis protein